MTPISQVLLRPSASVASETDMRDMERAFHEPVYRHIFRTPNAQPGDVTLCGRVKKSPHAGPRVASKFPLCRECARLDGRHA